ncbi:MAG: nucleoid-associated protein [Candidatus Kapaibacterium sp.]
MAIHEIIAKQGSQEHAVASVDDKLLQLEESVNNIIKNRFSKAASKTNKFFEMDIEKSNGSCFFTLVHKMKHMSDVDFIKASGELAYLLAESQTRNSIPGGYLLVIEAQTRDHRQVYIAVKCELHEALRYEIRDGNSQIRLLDDVFLSPSQKLYKIGIIYEREEQEPGKTFPNKEFGAYLFDQQFNPDSEPASYFFKDFLGFSYEGNSKIQSKRYYENTENFIKSNLENYEDKLSMLDLLRHQFREEEDTKIEPMDFAASYLQEPDMIERYANEVASYLPQNIHKDGTLLEHRLKWKKLNFPNKIVLSGPENTFEFGVEIIKDKEELDKIDLSNSAYTLIKISGKPFTE